MHFGFFHIFFNVLCLRDLGSMIEARQNSWILLALVAVFAAVSNFAQFMVGGYLFGGMSGVVHGLIGYIWIRGKYDPGSGLFIHSSTVTLMALIMGFWRASWARNGADVANVAHGVGLVMGVVWGFISSLRHR